MNSLVSPDTLSWVPWGGRLGDTSGYSESRKWTGLLLPGRATHYWREGNTHVNAWVRNLQEGAFSLSDKDTKLNKGSHPRKKNTLSFGHCPNCGVPPTRIIFETYLTANFPQNQYINIIMCFWAPISTSETSGTPIMTYNQNYHFCSVVNNTEKRHFVVAKNVKSCPKGVNEGEGG